MSKKRGFALMDKETRRKYQSLGGKMSPGNFKYDRKRASEAGKKSKRTKSAGKTV